MISYNFNKQQVYNNSSGQERWGNGSRLTHLIATRTYGDVFCSTINGGVYGGRITFSQNGFYRIRVVANPQTDGYNDRLAFMVYLRVGSTDYNQDQAYNFFGWSYTRNTSDGAHGNIMLREVNGGVRHMTLE